MIARDFRAQQVSSYLWGFPALAGVLLLLSGCALFKKKDEVPSEPYSPAGDEAGVGDIPPSFDNATDAILAARTEPASEAVRGLEAAFRDADYEGALAGALALEAGAEPGSEDLDAAVYIQAASLYYLGRHSEAQGPLDRHRAEFPESRYMESAQYYAGSNLVKQRRWRAGGGALDAFLRRFPESQLAVFALYDRASAHFALGEYDLCLGLAQRIETDFVYSKILDRVAVLKGDALQKRGEFAQAEAAYLAAKNTADRLSHEKVAARASRNLIEVAAEQRRWRDAHEYYQTFFAKYADSRQAPAAALAGLPVMEEMGQLDDGLDRIEGVLMALPEGASVRLINNVLRTYAHYFRELHGPEALLRRYGNLSSSGRGSERLRQQLVVARLEVLENYFPERSAEIRVFYEEIRSRFDPEDMATPTLLKVARHTAKTDLREGAAWFRTALARPGSEYRVEATLGLAEVLAASGEAPALAEAAEGFRKVLDSYGSPEFEEAAVLGLARLATRGERWVEARDYWRRYVDNTNWRLSRQEAQRGLEVALEKAGAAAPPQVSAEVPRVPEEVPVRAKATPPRTAGAGAAGGGEIGAERFQLKLRQAERLISVGLKEQAYEVLSQVVEQGEAIDGPPEDVRKTLRRAGILREDLGLELAKG